jgi:flavodoxin
MSTALVVYESIYGNTRAVAEAIADGLGDGFEVELAPVHEANPADAAGADLLVVGGPTHMHGLTSRMSRKAAVQAAEDEGIEIEPGAGDDRALRGWLAEVDAPRTAAATFDTRIDKPPALTGVAARGIAKRLRRRGCELIADPESFFVDDSEGPLAEGELDRAREWGRSVSERAREAATDGS